METDDIVELEAKASDVAKTLKVFANEQRVRILCRLAAAGELPITAIAADSDISQSALSQHLAKLRRSGAITARRTGHNLFYRIADPRIAALALALQDFVRSKSKSDGPELAPELPEIK